jgi:hypothetical protein
MKEFCGLESSENHSVVMASYKIGLLGVYGIAPVTKNYL